MPTLVLLLSLVAALAGLFWMIVRYREQGRDYRGIAKKYGLLQARFTPILDAEREAEKIRLETKHSKQALDVLNSQYVAAKTVHDNLKREIALLEETQGDISVGLYQPHYNYKTSDEYRAKLDLVRNQQKDMVHAGTAVHCAIEWSVGGSRKEGERMQKQYSKLLLRAFNGECDAATARVSWNNVLRMEERIKKAFEIINDLGKVMQINVTEGYHNLWLEELRLVHEGEQKIHEEAEEQRRIREQMREEERVQRELEKAKRDAEDEERKYQRALEKARLEVSKAKGAEVQHLGDKIKLLEEQLREAQERKERAIAQAQLTRVGHVYIISNVGSFGDGVFKIGMTRRLEPMDRVHELGDAALPFAFDVHAMIYSEDAPTLENDLHKHFDKKRVNLVNWRKEFFNITLDEIIEFTRMRSVKAEITRLAAAKEYRESLALRAHHQTSGERTVESAALSEF